MENKQIIIDEVKNSKLDLKSFLVGEAVQNEYEQQLDQFKQTLAEIKKIAEKSCCSQPTSDCEEYKNCKECNRTSDDETIKQILQKISEVEEQC